MYSLPGKLPASALKSRFFWLDSQENRPSRTISMIFKARLETLSDCFSFKKPDFKYCSNEKI